MERPIGAPDVGRAVVRKEKYQGIVQLTGIFEVIDETAYVVVGVVQHRRIGFIVAQEDRLFTFTE